MAFIACGLNHKTAPLNMRESLALSSDAQLNTLDRLLALPAVNEAVILSTCNRTELYCDTQQSDQILPWLAEQHQLTLEQLLPFTYLYQDQQAVQHVLRVAAGLDSMMIGEPQILGQIKQAFHQAVTHGAVGSQLHPIFQFIFSASKRIRTQSGIGHHTTSIAYAATQLISQRFRDTTQLCVFIIGTGETSTLVAKYLYQQGVRHFMVTSRTPNHAAKLAAQYGAQSISIHELGRALPKADIIVSATACPLPFIVKEMVEQALITRQHAPMFFLDLAVPLDIDPEVGTLPEVDLYNIDDLQMLTQQGLQQRQVSAQHAEHLIAFEMQQFANYHRSLRAKDLICHYRATMETLAQTELQRAKQQLENGQPHLEVLTAFSQRLIQKFTHAPTMSLRQAALEQRDEVLELAHYLFQSNMMPHEEIT